MVLRRSKTREQGAVGEKESHLIFGGRTVGAGEASQSPAPDMGTASVGDPKNGRRVCEREGAGVA